MQETQKTKSPQGKKNSNKANSKNSPQKKLFILRLIALIYIILLIALIILVDKGKMLYWLSWVHYIPFADKVGHFLLLGVASFVVNVALTCKNYKLFNYHFFYGSTILGILITLEEFSQMLIPFREFDVLDLASNYSGIWIFGLIGCFLFQKYLGKDIQEKKR